MPIAAPSTLPPLLRVLAGQVLGVTPYFAPGEVHRLPPARRRDPDTEDPHYRRDDRPIGTRDDPQASNTVLSAAEVVNLLRRCRYSRSPRFPIAQVAQAAGLSRRQLYRVMSSGKASERTRVALTPVLRAVADGTLGFERRARQWEQVEHLPPAAETAWAGPPGWQDKMVRHQDWKPELLCRICGNQRYTLVTIHDAKWCLCNTCLPWQTAGLGAAAV